MVKEDHARIPTSSNEVLTTETPRMTTTGTQLVIVRTPKECSCKLDAKSPTSSILALSVTALGAGILSLPYICKLCGLALGLIMLGLGCVTAIWSFSLLIRADAKGGGYKSFKELCLAIGGRRFMLFYNCVVIFTLYGLLTGYQVIISALVQRVLKSLGVHEPEEYRTFHIILLSGLVIFPVCLLKSVSSLRYATVFSIISMIYTITVLIVELPFYWSNGKADTSQIVYFRFNRSILSAFGLMFFAFASQTNFYAATENLEKKDASRLGGFSIFLNLALYLLVTVVGYMSTLENTSELIIDRESPFNKSKGIQMILAQILISCSVCVGIPINYVPARTAVFEVLFDNPQYTWIRGTIASAIFTVTTCIVTIYLPGITVVLGIVGGIGAVAVSFVIPLIAFLATHKDRPKEKCLYIAITTILTLVGIGSAVDSVLRAFN